MSGYRYRAPDRQGQTATADNGLRVGLVRTEDVRAHEHNVRRSLGDLRGLTRSIAAHGILQPVVVERRGDHLRLRAGHRRLAAAKLAGLRRIPAVIHAEALEDEEWLVASVQENEQRLQLHHDERVRAARALHELGCTVAGIADAFGISARAVQRLLDDAPGQENGNLTRRQISGRSRTRAKDELVRRHRGEFDQLLAEHRARLERDLLADA